MIMGTLNWYCPLESHEGILLGHVDPHHFLVYTIFKVFVFGFFPMKSLETVQADIFLLVLAVATQILDRVVVPLLILNCYEEIGGSPLVI